MAKMSDAALRAMLSAQYAGALASSNASKLSSDREKAQNYYNGDVSEDLPSAPGRSSAVSMDVSDTIEGIMPQLMEVFAGGDEVVKFDPVGPEDVEAAEQETDYINHVFMNQNPGFLVLYSFIKDALLSKVGVVKVWWEKVEKEQKETYLDKTEDEFALIVSNPDLEILEHTAHPSGLHDVKVALKKTTAYARVMGVPPEEFGIEAGARDIRNCNYCFHKVVTNTEADLIEQGYDEAQVKKLPTYKAWTDSEAESRDTVGEDSSVSDINTASRQVEITEHYVRMDYEGNGKSCLYKVTTGGKDGEILILDGKPDVVEFDAIPFAAMTPVIVTHRFYGKSIADLVMDIMRAKTVLLRAALDSLYIALNPRVVLSEQGTTDNTIDDLLVSRPNQIVRVKGDAQAAIAYQTSPDVSQSAYAALEYMDATREWRTGVTRQGQGIDANALQNQSATAVNQAFSASQARVRLIARIFAETGVKDLFWLLHGTIKKHGDQAQIVRLKNNWVNVDPRNWKSRDDLTVKVGLGTGSRSEQMARLTILGGFQEKIIMGGLTNVVGPQQIYNLASEMTKLADHKDVDAFFTDPSKQPPLEPRPDPKLIELQVKAQLEEKSDQRKAQIETVQAQADMATQDRKTTAEMAMADRKAQLEERLMLLDHELKREQLAMEMQFKREAHQADMQMKREAHEQAIASGAFKMAQGQQAHEQKMEASARAE